MNSLNGERVQRWQYKKTMDPFHDIGKRGETVSFYPYGADGWEDIPDGEQRLCYNELPTKINWHYLALDFDLNKMTCTQLRCNDRVFDLSGTEPLRMPAMRNLWCMLQPYVFVEADTTKRAFMYIDSAMLSAGEL